jgi:hypothetical protein
MSKSRSKRRIVIQNKKERKERRDKKYKEPREEEEQKKKIRLCYHFLNNKISSQAYFYRISLT